MGQAIPSRDRELKSQGSFEEKTFNIADLPPEEQEEWARKHGLDLNKIKGRNAQPSAAEAAPAELQVQTEQPKELTREFYLELKDKKINDKEIAKMYGIGYPNAIGAWKERNGLKNFQMKPDTTKSAVINEKTDIRFKKDEQVSTRQPQPREPSEPEPTETKSQDPPLVQKLEDELAQKDEELNNLQELLIETNQARLAAEAKVEALEIELRQIQSKKQPLDLRTVVAQLMSSGAAAVETFEEFQTIAEVLGKMKMPWIATHDTYQFNIETSP
ncbi:hypothetical protein [Brevibacillus centrosporus]|uniref:hypothetical protein n=1 Tax=Brevibacillus centrosporus TaxID=54910 RepID=UPI002E1C4E0B|nr:hypothetical protein [Brevibacillus centrosporus]